MKIKTFSTADAFVTGWAPGEHANEGMVGSLELSILKGEDVVPVAQVGNLSDDFRKEITAEDGSLKSEWYSQVVEFQGQGIGKNGRVRHAHMVRLRPDKEMKDCTSEQLDVFPRV